MRQQGRLTDWREDRGFGFITPDAGGERVFLHISEIGRGSRRPVKGDVFRYRLARDSRGRLQAKGASIAGIVERPRGASVRVIIVLVFFLGLAMTAMAGFAPATLPGGYALMSLVTILVYAWDKSAARKSRWRTPESTLHVLALVGGWPGALIAQSMLRHKTRKRSFQIVFALTVLLNLVLLIGWLRMPA